MPPWEVGSIGLFSPNVLGGFVLKFSFVKD